MLEQYYVRPDTVDRVRSSWIGEAIEKYVAWLAERKDASRSVCRRIPILVRLGEFASARGATDLGQLPNHVEPFVQKWVRERAGRKASSSRRTEMAKNVRGPIQQMLRLVVPGYTGLRRRRKMENPFEEQAPGFFAHVREEKGLRESTVRQYSHSLWQFASYLRRIGLEDLTHLTPAILSGFVIDYAQRVSSSSVSTSCGVLRTFLRYLRREQILARDLTGAIEYPQAYRLSGIPRSITWDDVRMVLEQADRRTAIGRRDYAILLLLVTYGLRAKEVAALTLDDLDWRNSRLRVPERKAGHSTAYPLSTVVGDAIIEYLKNGRPQTSDRHVFFRGVAPLAPITAAAVSSRAGEYLRRAGIKVPRPGSHTLRHTCVQRLVDADFTLKTIGDYVGHANPASTRIYSKVAVEALREVALGDGEDVL